MSAAQAADELAARQEKLESNCNPVRPAPVDAVTLQQSVAEEIAKQSALMSVADCAARTGDDPSWRNRAAETLLKAQMQLSFMPSC